MERLKPRNVEMDKSQVSRRPEHGTAHHYTGSGILCALEAR